MFRADLHGLTTNERKPMFWFVGFCACAKAHFNFHKDSMPARPISTICYGLRANLTPHRLISYNNVRCERFFKFLRMWAAAVKYSRLNLCWYYSPSLATSPALEGFLHFRSSLRFNPPTSAPQKNLWTKQCFSSSADLFIYIFLIHFFLKFTKLLYIWYILQNDSGTVKLST